VLGASAEDNPFASRPGATPNFVSIGANLRTSYRVFGPIMLRNGIVAQWSPDNLPFSQRCGFGTNSFSRAFDRSFVNGDSCLGARQEVAALLPAERLTAGLLRFGEVFVAGDGGILWNVDPIDVPERDGWASLYSGVRAAGDGFIAELSVSRILDQPDGSIPQDETRIWFRAAARF
jgi:hemolysin activation/secretion protein